MKKLCSAVLSLALIIVGCRSNVEEQLPPEIKITNNGEINVPAEGGTVILKYEISNPVRDAIVAVSVPEGIDWITPVSASVETAILEASVNDTESIRTTEIYVIYTWDNGEVSAKTSVIQEKATGFERNDTIEAITAIGVYYGNTFSTDAANYYFMLSDCEFAEGKVKSGPGMMLYFDCYGEKSSTPQNAKIPSGRYEYIDENAYGQFQISKEGTVFMDIDSTGMILNNIYPVSGHLDVDYTDGGGYAITGSFIMEDGREINLSYNGDFIMSNQSGVFGEDINIASEYSYSAVYYGDLYGSGACGYYFMIGTMEPDMDGGFPRGSGYYFEIDLWGTESEDPDKAIIPEGTYHYSSSIEKNVIHSDRTLGHCVIPDGTSRYSIPFTDGTVIIRHTAHNNYDISCTFILEDGFQLTVDYSGPLSFENQAPAESEDLDITFASGNGIYYGDIYGSGTANYTLEFLDQEGTTALTIDVNDILDGDTELSEGTYVVDEEGSMEAGKFYPGIIDMFGALGTYVILDLNSDTPEYLLITGGTFKIERVDGEYYFTFDFITQGGSKVRGSYKGAFPIE